MDMVRHQDPGPDLDARRRAMLAEQMAIERAIIVLEKGLRRTVAALGYVVGMPREDRPYQPRHGLEALQVCEKGN